MKITDKSLKELKQLFELVPPRRLRQIILKLFLSHLKHEISFGMEVNSEELISEMEILLNFCDTIEEEYDQSRILKSRRKGKKSKKWKRD